MADDIFADADHRMQQAAESLRKELVTIRTGRASPTLVERLSIDYYGTPTPLQQLATIHAPDARTLTIHPYDRKTMGDIEKAIQKSDLGLNPQNDGTVMRIIIPALTEDRRKDLVKVVHRKVDEAKVAVRNVRRDAHDQLRAQEKAKTLSEDEARRGIERLQKMTDKYTDELDHIGQAKEREILEV